MRTLANATPVGTVGQAILKLCDDWLTDYSEWDSDCAKVSRYYSGGMMESASDKDVLGLIDHQNYQSGRRTLARAKEETYSYFTQPQRLMAFKLKDYGDGIPSAKLHQEQLYSKICDRFLRSRDPQFLDECQQMVDRHVIHGDAVMAFPVDGWRPVQAKIITDINSPQNVHDDNFSRWALMQDIQISEVMTAVKEEHEGWTEHAKTYLEKEWKRIYDTIEDGEYSSGFDRALDMYCEMSPEEWESQGQAGDLLNRFLTTRFKCYYFFQKDFASTEDGKTPVDLYIVARFKGRDDETGDPLLYKRKAAYASVSEAVYEFVLDANLGVESPGWGTIKGLGHLSYTPDRMTNLLVSILTNSAMDKATPLWQVVNATDLKMIEKFMKEGYRAHSVIPAGLDVVDKGKMGASVGEALNLITYMSSQGIDNATGATADSSPTSRDELRVQSLNRQQRDARTANNRGMNFARKLDSFFRELGRRIADLLYGTGELDPCMRELKEDLLRANVELEWFYPENIDVSYSRLAGDGDPEKRMFISEQLMARLALIPDEERPNVMKEWYAALTGDWERAETIFGQGDQRSTDATVLAFTKVATVMELGSPLPITAEDLPEVSLPVIIATLNAVVGRAETAGQFAPDKFDGFMALGRYGIMMVQKVESYGKKEVARTWEGQIQELARRAEGPRNAMMEAMQAKQQAIDPIDQARLVLDERKVEVQEGKLAFDEKKNTMKAIDTQRGRDFQEYNRTKQTLQGEERLALERIRIQADLAEKQARMNEPAPANTP